MVTPAGYGKLFVLTLAASMIASQLYFPPWVETRWRVRLRWLFYLGAAIVIGFVGGRLYEVYRVVGL